MSFLLPSKFWLTFKYPDIYAHLQKVLLFSSRLSSLTIQSVVYILFLGHSRIHIYIFTITKLSNLLMAILKTQDSAAFSPLVPCLKDNGDFQLHWLRDFVSCPADYNIPQGIESCSASRRNGNKEIQEIRLWKAKVTWICVIAEIHAPETSGIWIVGVLGSSWYQAPETLLNHSGFTLFCRQVSFHHLLLLLVYFFNSEYIHLSMPLCF